jgi:hypothetical protein
VSELVDPQVRLQNIALETQELLAQRAMGWSETTNRAMMLMTVVGAVVVGLALVGQASAFDRSFLLFAVLVLPVVLVIGASTLGRINELDNQDWRWVQGLNRLRHARLELDPGFEKFLVLSPNDDAPAILRTYADDSASSSLHSFYVLATLIGIVDALLAAFLVAVVALILGMPGELAAIAGGATFIAVLVLIGISGYRSFVAAMNRVKPSFPTPSNEE